MCDPWLYHRFRKIISKEYYTNCSNMNCWLNKSISSIKNFFILIFLSINLFISSLIWNSPKAYCWLKKNTKSFTWYKKLCVSGFWLPSLFRISTLCIISSPTCLMYTLSLPSLSFLSLPIILTFQLYFLV